VMLVAVTIWQGCEGGIDAEVEMLDDAQLSQATRSLVDEEVDSHTQGLLERGTFYAVVSETSGAPEAYKRISWEMRRGVPSETQRMNVPVNARVDAPAIEREGIFWHSSVYRGPDDRAIASFTIRGLHAEMREAVGPGPQEYTDAAQRMRAEWIQSQRVWTDANLPRIENAVRTCEIEVLQVLSSTTAALAYVDFEQYLCLLTHPEVEWLDLSGEVVPDQARADNLEVREAVRTFTMNALSLRGQTGNRNSASDPIRLAVVDSSALGFNANHRVWRRNSVDTRLLERFTCDASECSVGGPVSTNVADHGTRVAYQAVGSLLNAQVSSIVDPDERQRRTGMAPDARFYYFHVTTDAGMATALQHIRDLNDVDVVTMSISPGCPTGSGWCHPSNNCYGINPLLRELVAAGTVNTKSAGNVAPTAAEPCTVVHPGYRTEVLGVANLDYRENQDYNRTVMQPGSSFGSFPITTNSGFSSTSPGISLMAPGGRRWLPSGTTGFTDVDGDGGTSNATPRVAGLAGLMRQSLAGFNVLTSRDARYVMVNMMLSGDTADGVTSTGRSATSVHARSGFGRVTMNWYNTSGNGAPNPFLGAPWTWGTNRFPVTQGNTTSWQVGGAGPEPLSTTEYRLALLWDEADLTSVSDITVEVWDVCTGGSPVLLAVDNSFHLRKRVSLPGSLVAGRCLEVRLRGWDVTGTKQVYVADLLRSGTPEWQ